MEIVKGKRTKRSRPHSPSSAYLSDERSTSTEEDQDMANCLILLAQGSYTKTNLEREDHQEEQEEEEEEHSKREKLIDSIANDTYIYECKTCDRTFTSFQALGGHRASHKKPRTNPKEDTRQVKREIAKGKISNFPSPPIPVHVATIKPILANKVHECSICGSEFSSGQALGGHMRRHRVAPVPQVKPPSESEEEESDDRKTINILSFDLNLPAPIEDDQNQVVESNFEFRPNNHLVFVGPALVGCHY